MNKTCFWGIFMHSDPHYPQVFPQAKQEKALDFQGLSGKKRFF
jgi:hypothetical protein